ncbi:MAG TPA: TIGR00300 family protein, partial [bacterium]|nr:TIGR00300 family protein [bacterium]
MQSKKIKLVGHIINNLSLSKVLDAILERGGDFRFDELEIGHSEKDISHASLEVIAPDQETLDRILSVISKEGAQETDERSVQIRQTEKDGAVPEDFYSTTNLETEIFLNRKWIAVEDIEMDCIIVVSPNKVSARCVPIADIRRGDWVVVGHEGIRVHPLRRDRPAVRGG